MASYQRQDIANEIANGNIVNADPLDAEFNALAAVFVASSGHRHNGLAGEGAPITVIGPSQNLIASTTSLTPKETNEISIGTEGKKFKDAFFTSTVQADLFSGNINSPNKSTFNKILGTAGGGGERPSYSFQDNEGSGMHYFVGTTTLAFIINEVVRARVTPTEFALNSGMKFTGDGSGLTNIPGSAIIGDVPTGGVAGAYPQLTGVGTLNSGSITAGFGNISIGNNTFTGNGSGLSNLNASQLSSGTVPNGRLTGNYSFGGLTLSGNLSATIVRVNDGSEAFPTYSYKSDTNTGIYRDAASTLGFTTNGLAKMRIATNINAVNGAKFSGDGSLLTALEWSGITGTIPNSKLSGNYSFDNLRLADGTAAVPSHSFLGDQDTGMWLSGTNQLGFSTNGVNRLTITSGGAVTATGTVTANAFSGTGGSITGLNADNISTGTLDTARLSTTTNARNWVLARVSEQQDDAVGTVAFLVQASDTNTNLVAGTTYAGSGLRYYGFTFTGGGTVVIPDSQGVAVTGTWKALGSANNANSSKRATLFVKVS